jgi:hypothetical protein
MTFILIFLSLNNKEPYARIGKIKPRMVQGDKLKYPSEDNELLPNFRMFIKLLEA